MSRGVLSNAGWVRTLRLRTRCGCKPYFCQMRWTVAGDSPTSLANRRALQCVAAFGLRRVALITAPPVAEPLRRRPPPSARPAPEPGQPLCLVAPSPQTDRALGYSQPPRQAAHTLAGRTTQNNARSHGQSLRNTLRTQPALHLDPICSAHFHPPRSYVHAEQTNKRYI